MNGLNGAHLVHGENNLPNGGTSVTSQAEFIKSSLEWITKEITKFKQDDGNLRLKFHNLNKMVGELRHELDSRPLSYMDSESSLGEPSRSSLEPTTIHQYTESPRLSRRSRTSPSPQPSPVKESPKTSGSPRTTPPTPTRVYSRPSPLTERSTSAEHSPPTPLASSTSSSQSSPLQVRGKGTAESKGSPPVLPRPYSYSPGKSPRRPSPSDQPSDPVVVAAAEVGSGSPSLTTRAEIASSPALLPKSRNNTPKTTPKTTPRHSPFLSKRAPKNHSPSPAHSAGKQLSLPATNQTTPTKPVTPQKYLGSRPQDTVKEITSATATGQQSEQNLPPSVKTYPPVVRPKPSLPKSSADQPMTTPTSVQGGGVSQLNSEENGGTTSPPLDHSSIDLSLDMSLGGGTFADDLFAALKTKGFGSLDM